MTNRDNKKAFQALEQACKHDNHNDETLVDAALQELPRSEKKLENNGDSINLNGNPSRRGLERRSSLALARILETLSTYDESNTSGEVNGNDSSTLARNLNVEESDQALLNPEVKMFLRRVIQEEFPQEVHPTLADLIHVGKSRDKKATLYKPGDWVEIQGADMIWQLEMVTRVVKQAPSDWDWNDPANEDKTPDWEYYYHAGFKRMLLPEELRSPKEGLLRLFGTRPFLWQQWVCVKLEQMLRFQKGHQSDFAQLDTYKFAVDYWERWLHHPRNTDFFNQFQDDRIGDFGRRQLVDHVMSPFVLMERVKHDHDRWNFDEDDAISIYSYLSIFGTVFLLPCVIVGLQFSIPGLLFYQLDYTADADGNSELCQGFENLVWYGTARGDCEINEVAQGMAIVVLAYYLFKVVPDTFVSFYNVLGAADTAYSKLQSIRHEIWNQQLDRFGQIVGYQMDISMNTAYVCLLYMLNVLVIINTNSAFEIILNALAFEFVIDLDHEFAKSGWWDPEKRWIKAGAVELILQVTIHKRTLKCAERFSKEYKVPLDEITDLFGDTNGRNCGQFLKDKAVAARDVENEKFMTNDEKVKFQCRKISHELENKHAIDEYEKHPVDFGTLRGVFRYITKQKGGGVFNRYESFRTWSRWDQLLYLPPIPNLDEVFDFGSADSVRIKNDLRNIEPTSKMPFANFSQTKNNSTDWEQFRSNYINVISFRDMCRTVKTVCNDKGCSFQRSAGVLFFDGPVRWFAFVIQGVFPFYNVVCIISVVIAVVMGDGN